MSIAKARVVRLAKSMFGNRAIVEERKNALDADGRQEATKQHERCKARRAELEPIASAEPTARKGVVNAAKAAVSMPLPISLAGISVALATLEAALAAYKEVEEAIAERSRLFKEMRNYNTHSKRCHVSEYDSTCGLPLSIHVADGDTWEEVLTKLEEIKAKKTVRV